jgi:A/G-specific adenine glycosylase
MGRFPTVESLAAASDTAVLVEWSGLGYNRRALALRNAARQIAAGGWPPDLAGLEGLPGVGRYTARALASLAFGEPVGVVDTNVRRWLVRRFGLPLQGGAADSATLQGLAHRLAGSRSARERADAVPAWTHATMEFGARVCTARRPKCALCPIARGCPSRQRPPRVAVRRQPAFRGSLRAMRGSILRQLTAAPQHSIALDEAQRVAGDRAAVARAVQQLQADGLVRLVGQTLYLGSRD